MAVVVDDIHDHVGKVSPKPGLPGQDSVRFWQEVRCLWEEDDINGDEMRVPTQFLVLHSLVRRDEEDDLTSSLGPSTSLLKGEGSIPTLKQHSQGSKALLKHKAKSLSQSLINVGK